jgi:hypothetical protein
MQRWFEIQLAVFRTPCPIPWTGCGRVRCSRWVKLLGNLKESKSMLDERKIETDTDHVACSGLPEALRGVVFVREIRLEEGKP